MRAARVRLATDAHQAAGKEGADEIVRGLQEGKARNCKTPLIDFMWEVDGETGLPVEDRVAMVQRGGLLREPMARLWPVALSKGYGWAAGRGVVTGGRWKGWWPWGEADVVTCYRSSYCIYESTVHDLVECAPCICRERAILIL